MAKRMLASILSFVLVFALAACGISSRQNAESMNDGKTGYESVEGTQIKMAAAIF